MLVGDVLDVDVDGCVVLVEVVGEVEVEVEEDVEVVGFEVVGVEVVEDPVDGGADEPVLVAPLLVPLLAGGGAVIVDCGADTVGTEAAPAGAAAGKIP